MLLVALSNALILMGKSCCRTKICCWRFLPLLQRSSTLEVNINYRGGKSWFCFFEYNRMNRSSLLLRISSALQHPKHPGAAPAPLRTSPPLRLSRRLLHALISLLGRAEPRDRQNGGNVCKQTEKKRAQTGVGAYPADTPSIGRVTCVTGSSANTWCRQLPRDRLTAIPTKELATDQ